MKIITRRQAITQRLTKFYTGRPCIYGHLTNRYTKNGACCDCINPKFESARSDQRRTVAVELMRPYGFVIHVLDLERFKITALFYARLREHNLRPGDLNSGVRPAPGLNGFSNYVFKIFSEDAETLRAMEAQLKQTRKDSIAITRAGL
jgi:hypothetical protein